MTVLVVAAMPQEVAGLPDGVDVVLTGIGKVEAAIATTEAVLARRPSLVVNLGTAGSLDGRTGLFTPSRVLNHDLSSDVLRQIGYDPLDALDLSDGDGSVLATGDVFVTDPVARDALARRANLVDMEGFAVAAACRRLGVPVRLVKHVSDHADDGAMDWADLVHESAIALAAWFRTEVG